MPVQVREAGDERGAVARLELVEARAVDEPRDQLAHVVRRAQVARQDAVDLLRVERGRLGRAEIEPRAATVAPPRCATMSRAISSACASSSAEMVGDARDARVHVAAAQLLRA